MGLHSMFAYAASASIGVLAPSLSPQYLPLLAYANEITSIPYTSLRIPTMLPHALPIPTLSNYRLRCPASLNPFHQCKQYIIRLLLS